MAAMAIPRRNSFLRGDRRKRLQQDRRDCRYVAVAANNVDHGGRTATHVGGRGRAGPGDGDQNRDRVNDLETRSLLDARFHCPCTFQTRLSVGIVTSLTQSPTTDAGGWLRCTWVKNVRLRPAGKLSLVESLYPIGTRPRPQLPIHKENHSRPSENLSRPQLGLNLEVLSIQALTLSKVTSLKSRPLPRSASTSSSVGVIPPANAHTDSASTHKPLYFKHLRRHFSS